MAVAIGLTAVILWRSDPGSVWRASVGIDWRWVGLAALLVIADRALMAYRWLVLLRPLPGAAHLSLGAVMRIFFISTFVGNFLPATVGGDAVRAVMLAREGVPVAGSVASVFMDRVLGVLSVLLVALVGLAFAQHLASHPAVIAAIGFTLAGCAATAAVVFSARAAALVEWMVDRAPWPAVTRVSRSLLEAVRSYGSSHRELLNVLVGSIGVQLFRIVQAYCLGRAIGIAAPLTIYVAFIPIILLVMLLPVTINGLGTSQLAFVELFATAGVARAPAFTLSVLFVALGIVGNLPGGLLYLRGGLDRSERAPVVGGPPGDG